MSVSHLRTKSIDTIVGCPKCELCYLIKIVSLKSINAARRKGRDTMLGGKKRDTDRMGNVMQGFVSVVGDRKIGEMLLLDAECW